MDKCYPLAESGSVAAAVWCMANAVIGFSGNLLTLLAIPAARRRKKFGFHDADYALPSILNLALADMLYCAINLPMYSAQFFPGHQWQLGGQLLCSATAAFRYWNKQVFFWIVTLVGLHELLYCRVV